jgi:hypothetical protein
VTSNPYGPDKPCQRTKCATVPPHLAGRHLDQRDELYDGPDGLLQVLPLAVRDSARKLVREAPALMPEVVDMAKHIEFLGNQVAHVSVDADRRERRAMAAAESCEQHGKDIVGLNEQLHAADRRAEQNNNGRLALVSGLSQIEDYVNALLAGPLAPETSTVLKALSKALRKTGDAHMRAWKK